MTEPSKIKEFFGNLNDRGIKVWENFLCCNNCASVEISESERSASDMGFCFYHAQDVTYAAERGILYLKWGAFEDDPMDALIVSNAILDEGKACGIDITWDNNTSHAIVLKGLDPAYFSQQIVAEDVQ